MLLFHHTCTLASDLALGGTCIECIVHKYKFNTFGCTIATIYKGAKP